MTESSYYLANGQLARKERHKPDGTMDAEDATTYAYNQNGDATTGERGTHDYNARDQETSWTESILHDVLRNPTVVDRGDRVIDAYNAAGQGVRLRRDTGAFQGFLDIGRRPPG